MANFVWQSAVGGVFGQLIPIFYIYSFSDRKRLINCRRIATPVRYGQGK